MENDLQTLLTQLTAEYEASKNLAVEIKKLDEDTAAFDASLTATEQDIATFLEAQSKAFDALLLEGQQEVQAAAAESAGDEA